MIIEMECNICGSHKNYESTKLHICDQCDNGIMVPYRRIVKVDDLNAKSK
jgi:ribosome-binding protein aMBF1 (putative translation factor)